MLIHPKAIPTHSAWSSGLDFLNSACTHPPHCSPLARPTLQPARVCCYPTQSSQPRWHGRWLPGTHNVAYLEHGFEGGAHAVVLHGHEDCVHHNAQGDGELRKGVRHNLKQKRLELHPLGAALPDQILLSQADQAGRALLFRFLELCITGEFNDSCQPCVTSDPCPVATP